MIFPFQLMSKLILLKWLPILFSIIIIICVFFAELLYWIRKNEKEEEEEVQI